MSFVKNDVVTAPQLRALGSIRILIEYIFMILFAAVLVSIIFPKAMYALSIDPTETNVHAFGELLASFLGILAAGLVAFLALKRYFPAPSMKASLFKVGMMKCSLNLGVAAALTGFLISIFFSKYLSKIYPAEEWFVANPLALMTRSSTALQLFLLFIVVCMAPLVEEVIFRGILYEGFARSWGKLISGSILTLVFVLLHYRSLGGYWPAATALILMSVVFIMAREFSGSLVPPILIHQFYNLGLAMPL